MRKIWWANVTFFMLYEHQVYNSCHSWETAFIIQAFCSTDLIEEFGPMLEKAHNFMKCSQVCYTYSIYYICYSSMSLEYSKLTFPLRKANILFLYLKLLSNHPNHESYYRHRSKGSWTLSTADNGCSVSDCTAEALKVYISLPLLNFYLMRILNCRGRWTTGKTSQNIKWSWHHFLWTLNSPFL